MLTNEEIAALFEQRAQQIEARIAVYQQEVQAPLDRDVPVARARLLWQLTLDYGRTMYETEIKLAQEMADRAWQLPSDMLPKSG